jgi:hypothetical protein
MKISYEKLNQIIEEEVARFKQLNEQTLNMTQFNAQINRLRNVAVDQVTLDRITTALAAITGK